MYDHHDVFCPFYPCQTVEVRTGAFNLKNKASKVSDSAEEPFWVPKQPFNEQLFLVFFF